MWTIKKKIKKGDYDYALVPEHPNATANGYVLYHRVVVENKLGRLLSKDDVVHHINGDKKDNRPENLQVTSASEHMSHHASAQGHWLVEFRCPSCDKKFVKRKNNSLSTSGGSKTRLFFCSRSCSGSYRKEPRMTQSENIIRVFQHTPEQKTL